MRTDLYINEDESITEQPLAEDDDIITMFYYFEYDKLYGGHYSDGAQAEMIRE
jgi:hypothetical protein